MRRSIITIILLVVGASVQAQDFQQVLDSIRSQHPGIHALEQQSRAGAIATKTGNYPGPLSVSYGFFPENSTVIGTKETVGVSQSFDFPTLYGAKKRQAEKRRELIDVQTKGAMQQEMLRVAQLLTDYVAFTQKTAVLTERNSNATKLKEAYEAAFEQGEVSALEVNKVRVHALQMAKALRLTKSEQQGVMQELEALNGDASLPALPEVYPLQPLQPFDAVLAERLAKLPGMQQIQKQQATANAQVAVEKHANLPGLSVGYASETVADESFKGVTMGLSIPLWSNKNKLEAAKARASAAEMQVASREAITKGQTERLYIRCKGLLSEVENYQQTLREMRSEEMLNQALELGELSVIDYLQELQFYYEVENELLQLEQSYQKALWELYQYKL